MIDLNLQQNILEQPKDNFKGTRDGFGDALLQLASKNENIVALCADLTESLRLDKFRETFPQRFFEMGVAEQNMIGVAAGLSTAGKIPFAASYAVFSPGRTWDQIRVSVCYPQNNVKIIGGHTGLTVGPDGATHQAMEDIALMRVLPNMKVLIPCDYWQAYRMTEYISKTNGPFYLRLGRNNLPQITTEKTLFDINKAQILKEGSDVTIIASGIMVYEALKASNELSKNGVSAEVINLHTIKPIDKETIIKSAEKTKFVITAEEHQVYGGVGSAVTEVLSVNAPTKIKMVAINDTFGESGNPDELMKKYKITSDDIIKAFDAREITNNS